MQARLAATDLACRRGERLLFRGLSLSLEAGDALHVTGPNGVGKTSLMRLLAGLSRPFAGRVERTGPVAMLDERLALDGEATLEKALAFWGRLDRTADPSPVYERLGLTPLLGIPVRYLSTGQRKRAALARLAGQDAKIWLLDEPLNGLDRQAQETVAAMVGAHREGGGLCIIASHQPTGLDIPALALEPAA
ncbi:heme ABC exporter ATP-binding protein CcmA [Erythrobacteraceae bacterium WH01K]|nr:heme ABC exporter ATP-binding protein CcmA [Erythrobacteraceae bacterium WH01K]